MTQKNSSRKLLAAAALVTFTIIGLPVAAAADAPGLTDATRQRWGPLSTYAGRTWQEQGPKARWTLRVHWEDPGRRLIEHWDLDGKPALSYAVTLMGDGRLRRETLSGDDAWAEERQADGAILWRGGLLTPNLKIALGAEPDTLLLEGMGSTFVFRALPEAQAQTSGEPQGAAGTQPQAQTQVPASAAEAAPSPQAVAQAQAPAPTGQAAAAQAAVAEALTRAQARHREEAALRAQAAAQAQQQAKLRAAASAKLAADADAEARKQATQRDRALAAERARADAAGKRPGAARQAAAPASTQPIEARLEEGAFDEVLALVDAMERRAGASPRLESLRALALEGAGRKRDAYRSLLVYAALTRGANLQGDEAHRDLLQLRDQLGAQLQAEMAQRQEQEASARRAAAKEVLAASTQGDRQRVDELAAQSLRRQGAKVDALLGTLQLAQIRELKKETQAPQLQALDERIFRIPQIATGSIRLGLTEAAFRPLIEQRVKSYAPRTRHMRSYVEGFRVKLQPARESGRQVFGFGAQVMNESLDGVRARNWGDFMPEAEAIARLMLTDAERAGLQRMLGCPGALDMESVEFDSRGILDRMHFACYFPRGAWPGLRAVRGHLEDQFGPPTAVQVMKSQPNEPSYEYAIGKRFLMSAMVEAPFSDEPRWRLHMVLERFDKQ